MVSRARQICSLAAGFVFRRHVCIFLRPPRRQHCSFPYLGHRGFYNHGTDHKHVRYPRLVRHPFYRGLLGLGQITGRPAFHLDPGGQQNRWAPSDWVRLQSHRPSLFCLEPIAHTRLLPRPHVPAPWDGRWVTWLPFLRARPAAVLCVGTHGACPAPPFQDQRCRPAASRIVRPQPAPALCTSARQEGKEADHSGGSLGPCPLGTRHHPPARSRSSD